MNTGEFQWRHELGRKAVHLGTGVLSLWIWFVPAPWSWRGPVLAFLGVLTVDLLRLGVARFGGWLEPRVGACLRPSERRGPVVAVHELTGAAAILALAAPAAIAATAFAYAAVGDAAAALVGRRFGTRHLGAKSLEGSLACFACCLVLGAVTMPGRPAAVWGGALVATLVEALPLPVHDNLSVPLVAAVALAVLG